METICKMGETMGMGGNVVGRLSEGGGGANVQGKMSVYGIPLQDVKRRE